MSDSDNTQDGKAMPPASAGSVAGDIVDRLRHTVAGSPRWYRNPDGPEAADEIERLREAIRRIAEQDATLSVQGGNLIVDMTEEKVVRLPSTFTASNVGGWVILALADSLNAAGVKWEVAEE